MPLYDQMYYDQKWSLWDTWKSFGRNCFGHIVTASYRLGRVITTQKRRGDVVTTQKRRGDIIKAGG